MRPGTLLVVTICGLAAALAPASAGVKEKVLIDLRRKDGGYPWGTPIFDAGGNLYATAFLGGKHGGGTLFELSGAKAGKGAIRVLHDFGKRYDFDHPKDGDEPSGPLTFDSAGNLYGTTYLGGKYANPDTGGGIVYRLAPVRNGAWTETVLHDFGNGQDAAEPNGGVILDASGNLYGTSEIGSAFAGNCSGLGCGGVFELSPDGKGGWTETSLHGFGSSGDGYYPYGSLVADSAGNIYGTTMYGGAHGDGIVFELSPGTKGEWTETVLYSFCARTNCADGAYPFDGLTLDAAGNLYGTTNSGGTTGNCLFGSTCGTVFELSLANGQWTESVLHAFTGSDGDGPTANVVFDAAGNLFGTAYFGGSDACDMGCGTVFELTPGQNGSWSETTLHQFQNGRDGTNPYGGLVPDAAGRVYGGSSSGPGTGCGGFGCGAIYSIRP
ncbi:MAG TPA: choice-of-anchor tandem repeat GloVer-containing protein [Rhizomicrobium sp.]|nr:choice-of-anchor tandem repeat GloVer-containing protein [Rhizomicrobium sp.]